MGVQINPTTGKWEYVPDSSLTLQDPLMQTNDYSPAKQTSDENSSFSTKLLNPDWWVTPLGGANTKSPFEIGLNSIGGFANLWGTIYSSNKQIDELKATRKANEQYQIANLTNNASTQLGNMTNHTIAANDWSKAYGQQVAQNYTGVGQTMANAVGALGGNTSGLQNQINNLSKYSNLQVA